MSRNMRYRMSHSIFKLYTRAFNRPNHQVSNVLEAPWRRGVIKMRLLCMREAWSGLIYKDFFPSEESLSNDTRTYLESCEENLWRCQVMSWQQNTHLFFAIREPCKKIPVRPRHRRYVGYFRCCVAEWEACMHVKVHGVYFSKFDNAALASGILGRRVESTLVHFPEALGQCPSRR
jgi:hypothetical protein